VSVAKADNPSEVIATGTTSVATGIFDLEVLDTANFTGSHLRITVTGGAGAEMLCDAPNGCGTITFGGRLPIDNSFSLSAIIPTPAIGSVRDVYLSLYTDLIVAQLDAQSGLITSDSLAAADAEVRDVFGINLAAFDTIAPFDITGDVGSNATEAYYSVVSGGLLGAVLENPNGLEAGYNSFRDEFVLNAGEILVSESTDDLTLVSLQDIYENGAALQDVNLAATAALTTAINTVDARLADVEAGEVGQLTVNGVVIAAPPPPPPPPVPSVVTISGIFLQ